MTRSCLLATLGIVVSLTYPPALSAQAAGPDREADRLDAPVTAVTVYIDRASVTRTAELMLQAGIHDLEFACLPESVRPDTLQARVDGPAKVLSVDYEERRDGGAARSDIAELDAQIEAAKLAIRAIDEERNLLDARGRFIDSVSVRARSDAGDKAGTDELDMDAVRDQLEFITESRTALLAEQREIDIRDRELNETLRVLEAKRADLAGTSQTNLIASVSLAVTEPADIIVELVYLVSDATWQPSYNVRASAIGAPVTIEYDAMLTQRTGEDWDDVKLTLSTAQPTVAANPPVLPPWYVDVYDGSPRSAGAFSTESLRRGVAKAAPPGPADEDERFGLDLEAFAADAEIGGGGPSVTFALPRPVTVKTSAAQLQRTRIANIDAPVDFIHVAMPLLTEAVYLRGNLTNAGGYHLLPGAASIFVDQDYVGPTRFRSVAPGERFDLYFGIDHLVSARHTLINKETSKTGLLGGGKKTSYQYRIEINNKAGQMISLELWDRYPVSRTDQIQIELTDLSHSLATDVEYIDEKKPQGLLKWRLNIPPTAGSAGSFAVTYGVVVNRSKDSRMPPLPE